ncbi:MAG: sulfotransferase domain-containing protein [Crocosphaera sp.]
MLQTQKKWLKYAVNDFQEMQKLDSNATYLVSFPKCGRTWLSFMLSEMIIKAYNIETEKSTILIDILTKKHPNLPQIIQTHEDSYITDEQGHMSDVDKLFIYSGRFKYLNKKVILVVRDPRDVVVSHYYQITRRVKNCPLEINSLTEFVRHPLYGFERIIRFYQIWNRNRRIPGKFLLIRYEDLILKGVDTLSQIVNFLDLKKIAHEIISEVYELGSAENMRKMELKNEIQGMKFLKTDKNSLKVRNAKIGSYLEELSEDDISYCNTIMKKLPKIYAYQK